MIEWEGGVCVNNNIDIQNLHIIIINFGLVIKYYNPFAGGSAVSDYRTTCLSCSWGFDLTPLLPNLLAIMRVVVQERTRYSRGQTRLQALLNYLFSAGLYGCERCRNYILNFLIF